MSEIEEIKETQKEILEMLKEQNKQANQKNIEPEYIDRKAAAFMLSCEPQMFANLEKEGRIKRHGRGRFIRYSVQEIREMMSGKS